VCFDITQFRQAVISFTEILFFMSSFCRLSFILFLTTRPVVGHVKLGRVGISMGHVGRWGELVIWGDLDLGQL